MAVLLFSLDIENCFKMKILSKKSTFDSLTFGEDPPFYLSLDEDRTV